jgi:hypothetical protein
MNIKEKWERLFMARESWNFLTGIACGATKFP